MKNIVLSTVAVLAMSSFAVAGGDIAPVEEPIVVVESVVTDSGLYLGLGYGFMNAEITDSMLVQGGTITNTVLDEDFSSIMIQAGYKFNSYIAVEGRYWFGLDSDTTLFSGSNNFPADVTVDAWGIYVKPMYPVTDAFDIYALLGYAGADISTDHISNPFNNDGVDGFSWGLGAAYSFTDNLAVFVDYVNIYDDEEDYIGGSTDTTIDSVTLGVSYKF